MNERKKTKGLSLKRKTKDSTVIIEQKPQSDGDNANSDTEDQHLPDLMLGVFRGKPEPEAERTEENNDLLEIRQFIKKWREHNCKELDNLPHYQETTHTGENHDISLKSTEMHNLLDLPKIG